MIYDIIKNIVSSFTSKHIPERSEEETMRLKETVAHEIWKIREELCMSGTEEHDWWLAEQFLEEIKDERIDEDTIYLWFVQLDENLVKREGEQ